MKDDAIWQAFAQTGDPLYYLLYKETEGKKDKKKDKKPAGQPPRAEG